MLIFKKGLTKVAQKKTNKLITSNKNPFKNSIIFSTQKKKLSLQPPPGYDETVDGHESADGLDIAEVMLRETKKDKTAKKKHAFSIQILDKNEKVDPFVVIEKDKQQDPETYKYKTKYPDEKFETWIKKYEETYLDETPASEQFIDDAVELSGWTKDEVKSILIRKVPDFAEYDQNGKFKNIKWENVKSEFKFDPRINSVIDEIDSSMSMIQYRLDNQDRLMKSLKYFDWQKKEREIDEEKALEVRERARDMFVESYREPKLQTAVDMLHTILDPVVDRAKDTVIDGYPMFEKLALESKSIDRQLELDEEGYPVWDYASIEFLDTFYPEVRDEILVEIDNFDFDIEYKEQFKQLSHQTTDDLYNLISDEYWRKQTDRVTNEFFRNYEDTSDTKRNILVAKSKQELDEKIEENAMLAVTVSKLKSQMDYLADNKEKGEGKKEEIDEAKGREILKTIGINPDGKLQIIKDWKHKPHEIIEEDSSPEK